MRRFVVPAVIVAVFAGAWGIAALFRDGGDEPAPPGVVRLTGSVPTITGRTLDGRRFPTSPIHGEPLVVNFWNPYCAPCRKEATILDLAFGKLASTRSGVVFLGILYSNANFPHDVPAARRFARELGVRYPLLDDPDGRLADAFSIKGIPTTMIADGQGRLRYAVLGAVKRGQVERLVRRVLRD